MEILAPAGNKEQALSAIEAGCNAIYGGLSRWNARNRADNFTYEEFNETVKICRERGVLFYLTLNTLMRNDEITDIIKLLSSGQITMPDAFIVADVGLMIELIDKYCNIPVHASTQFGASTVEDVLFLQCIGVRRVVLARELSLIEIKKICASVSIEVEVFIYGSQCVCFSGQCLYGGILHGNSGNRGRCIGMCQDIYDNNGVLGQHLYPQDLNAIELKDELENIGVSSVKIEGRMRGSQEICRVIHELNEDVESEKSKYYGFLSGNNPVKGMFNKCNPRQKYRCYVSSLLSNNDLIINDDRIIYYNELIKGDTFFLKSLNCNRFKFGDINISLKLITKESALIGIDYINSDGERAKYYFDNNKCQYTSINELYDLILKNISVNVYEISASLPSESIVSYNRDELLNCIKNIDIVDKVSAHDEVNVNRIKCNVVETLEWESVLKYNECHDYNQVIYDIGSIDDLLKVINALPDNNKTLFRLPRVDFMGVSYDMLKALIGQRIIIGKYSQLMMINREQFKYKEIIADYTLNIWNDATLLFVKNNSVTGLIIHPELSLNYFYSLLYSLDFKRYVVGKSFLIAGFIRGCFGMSDSCNNISETDCRKKRLSHHEFDLYNIQKGFNVKVICDPNLGIRKIEPDVLFYCDEENDDELMKIVDDRLIDSNVANYECLRLYGRYVK